MHLLRFAAVFGAFTLALVGVGCVTELDDLGGADLFEPIDEGDNVDQQGLYSCSERSDRGYRAGNDFAIKVVTVDGRPVEVDTANAYIVMQEAARRAGVQIRIVSGFRTQAEQQYLYGCYVNCSCNSCNLAATPGYSNHQSGHALDLNTADGSVLNWLDNNGARFGFRRTVAGEPWHWEWWSGGPGGGPCGDNGLPRACNTGDYDGVYCDDDKNGNEAEHNYLWQTLDVHWRCEDKAGQRAFCPGKDASRAEAMMVFGKAFDMPTRGLRNAFVDDGGHRYERFLNGAAHFDILEGDDRRVTPDKTLTRSGLAVILKRTFALPPTNRDFFDDDDGDSTEDAHNRVAAAGLIMGKDDGNGRRDFRGGRDVNRSALAVVARRAARERLVPVWDLPTPCRTGRFDGQFCDDDTHDNEAAHNALVNRLDTPFSCADKGNRPAFCPGQTATRGQAIYVLTRSQGIPRRGHPDAFRDDTGHPNEDAFDAAHAFGIIRGYDNDREVRAGIDADRTMVAVMLARMFDLPAADRDYFTDDNGDDMEPWHNKVAAAGLFAGYDNGRGGRAFRGDEKATRSMLATVAVRASDLRLTPIWGP